MPAPDVNGFDPGPALVCKTCGFWFCAEPCPDAKPAEIAAAKEVVVLDASREPWGIELHDWPELKSEDVL